MAICWIALLFVTAKALDNGIRVPPMGWSSWYGFTSNINEKMLRDMASGMVSSGLRDAGYEHIWIDDGWALPRDNITHKPGVDAKLFPSGMRNLSDYIHALKLKFGIYTSKGPLTCLGYQPTQPNRPGSCGFEQIDADTYAHDWQVDQVKDDGCGPCPQHEPFAAMRDALNKTGRQIVYAIHSDGKPWQPGSVSNGSVANMWRTGGDLSASSYQMWLDRLDLATDERMRPYVGPGAFANPDFLEVGYSPRAPRGGRVMTLTEQRSMFTFWSALPAPLILSADLRPGAASGGVDDPEVMKILTNKEVIAINQDPLVIPIQPVLRADGVEIWKKRTTKGTVVIFFSRNHTQSGLKIGSPLTLTTCDHPSTLSLDLEGGMMRVVGHPSLCVGSIGTSKCSNPPSPRMGLVTCNPTDKTQHWVYDPATKQINNDAGHDLNAASACAGDTGSEILLYVTQGHHNEHFTPASPSLSNTTIKSDGGQCLAWAPEPTPGVTRTMSVTWKEMGWEDGERMTVRDVWNGTDLGVFTSNFTATVQWHEARLFLMSS